MQFEYSHADRQNTTAYLKPDNQTIFGNLTSDVTEDHDKDHSCYGFTDSSNITFASKLFLFTSMASVAMGLTGNMINIIVMSRYLQKYSSSVYIFLLAISDSVYLISTLLGVLLKPLKCYYFKETNIDFVNHNNFACKLFHYLMDLSSDYSSIIILCFSVERFLAVCKPIKVKLLCKTKIVQLLSFILLMAISVSISPHHFMMLHTYYHACVIDINWEGTYFVAYVVELTIFRIVPVIMIATFNILIIYQMARKSDNKTHRSKYTGKNVTIILILISISYIVLYLPVLIHFILWNLMQSETITLSEMGMEVAQKYTSILYICGFSINFYLYSVGSKLFRQQLKETWDAARRRGVCRT